MNYRASEIKAGIFIFVSLLIFVGFLFVIFGLDAWTETKSYRARFQYVGGVSKGSSVRYAGLEVGKVEELILPESEDNRVELVLSIDEKTPIRQDSRAVLTTIGIMGAYYVEIYPGSGDSPLLPPGSLIPTKDVPGFAQLAGPAGEVMGQVNDLVNRMNVFLDEQNRERLSSTITAVNELTLTTNKNLDELMKNLNNVLAKMGETFDKTNHMLAANDTTLQKSFVQMNEMLMHANELVKTTHAMVNNVNHQMTQNKGNMELVLQNMVDISQNLNEFTGRIKERPWDLIRKTYPKERELPK
jgi:phospholipid/cholesterol/gamma-HCH transport system substrate-binding protein